MAEGGLESVPEHLRAQVLELAGELAEDYPDMSTEKLLKDAAVAVMQLEEERLEHAKRASVRARGWRVLGVLGRVGSLVGLGWIVWTVLQPSSRERRELLEQEHAVMLRSIPSLVDRQSALVAPLVQLGADEALLRASAVPADARLDERLELAIDLQRTLELEHASVVPSTLDERDIWNEQLEQLETVRQELRLLDLRLELNAEQRAKASSW